MVPRRLARIAVEDLRQCGGKREPVTHDDHSTTTVSVGNGPARTLDPSRRGAAAPKGSPPGGANSGFPCTASQKPRVRSSAGVNPSHAPKSYSASRVSILTGSSPNAARRSCAGSTARPSGLE